MSQELHGNGQLQGKTSLWQATSTIVQLCARRIQQKLNKSNVERVDEGNVNCMVELRVVLASLLIFVKKLSLQVLRHVRVTSSYFVDTTREMKFGQLTMLKVAEVDQALSRSNALPSQKLLPSLYGALGTLPF